MSQQSSLDTPENWNLASKGYAEKVAPYFMEPYAEEFVQYMEVDNTSDVLEIATGSGALALSLAKEVKSLLATDFSPGMLDILKIRVHEAGLTNVTFALMDGQEIKLENNSMDGAACSFGLMLFPDRHKGFSELNRVVKPGGKVLVSTWTNPDQFEALGIFMSSIQQAFPDMPKPDTPPPVLSLADPVKFKSEMENAGFREVEIHQTTRQTILDNFEQMWSMLTIGAPPIRKLIEQVGSTGLDRIKLEMAKLTESKFGNGPITLNNTANVGVGIAD